MDIINSTLPMRVNDTGTLRFIIGSFLARYPANSRATYGFHLKSWIAWCDAHGLDPLLVQRGHIEAYSRHIVEERGLKVSTQAQHVKAVCGLYHFAFLDDYITTDPGKHVRRPKVEFKSTTNGLTVAEAERLLWAVRLRRWPAAEALVHFLLMNGCRIGETMAANIEHLGTQGARRTIHLPHRKGGKTSTLGLDDSTVKVLERAIDGRTSGPIFLGLDGERMKVSTARRIVARAAKKAGIDKRITPHSLRHAFVTMALDAGVPQRDIMDSTAHSNPVMLVYYDRSRGNIERCATYAVAALFDKAA